MAWQYKTIYVHPENISDLADNGYENWEAFSAAPVGGISNLWVVWLKRPNYDDVETGDPTPEQEAEFQAKRRGRKPKGE